ncbi:MAG: hypothetical protein HXY38_10480 [Chloroflexi bacterium]|nr:hypothetical protein [Chloroflexota bacterium]
MIKTRLSKRIFLALLVGGLAVGAYVRIKAQEDVVLFLRAQLERQSVPVVEIETLDLFPLRLKIVTESANTFVTRDDQRNLHAVDRAVIVSARQHEYVVDSYVKILIDNQGNEIYNLDKHNVGDALLNADPSLLSAPSNALSQNEIEDLAREKIYELTAKYNLPEFDFEVIVSSLEEGLQSLNVTVWAKTLDEGYSVAGLIFPLEGSAIPEINEKGARIVLFEFEINDEAGNYLLSYFIDTQLQTGNWSHSDAFPIDLFGSQPAPAPSMP